MMHVLFETPSGFAILAIDGMHLYLPDAMEVALFFLAWLLMRLVTLVVYHRLIFCFPFQNIWEKFADGYRARYVSVPSFPYPVLLLSCCSSPNQFEK
jgi:hypothetical protein